MLNSFLKATAMSLLLTTLMSLSTVVWSADVGISFYPGENIFVGETLILECRVTETNRSVEERRTRDV